MGSHPEGESHSKDELRSERGFVYSRYGIAYERAKSLQVSDYLNNEAMIKQLHEEKEIALEALQCQRNESKVTEQRQRDEVESLKSSNQNLELTNQRLKDRLDGIVKSSSRMLGLQILAIILLGIGINLVTGNPLVSPWFLLGCAMLILGIVAEYVAFKLKPGKEVAHGQN